MSLAQPAERPRNIRFSSGPCAKHLGWSLDALGDAYLSRSHRTKGGKAKLGEVIERSRALLGMPDDYVLGIVPASDTGAMEMALWSLLGPRGVDMLAWESFGKTWAQDAVTHLKLTDVRVIEAPYGSLPDLSGVDPARDCVFTWNGTTSGVCVPNGDWIDGAREGLTICDATSAAFAMDLDWPKLDAVTWSWQKCLGGEAAHGMLALSPRAVARLESHVPAWPLPKVFRLTKGGKLNMEVFEGTTINTPSMLAVEDALDSLRWAKDFGGLPALMARSRENLDVVASWVAASGWVEFLAHDPASRSSTSICLAITDPWFKAQPREAQAAAIKRIVSLVEGAGAGLDIGPHRDAPPGLRIWGGPTVETSDLAALLPWLDWAYADMKQDREAA